MRQKRSHCRYEWNKCQQNNGCLFHCIVLFYPLKAKTGSNRALDKIKQFGLSFSQNQMYEHHL